MRAPDFWSADGLLPTLLSPAAALYGLAAGLKQRSVRPVRAPLKVICVGNLVAGGAGKTPTALAVADLAAEVLPGLALHFLSRGHGGRLRGPHRVDPARDTALDVGDEPLLLAERAPTWIARDRPAGAAAAAAAGARLLVMDDGFQNPSLAKDLSLIVVDGGYGFGNGRLIPAGPLREPIAAGVARADAAVIVGPDRTGAAERLGALPVLRATLEPQGRLELHRGARVLAFAGIGRPDKFFETVAGIGAVVVEAHAFPDHWRYRPDDVMRLCERAAAKNARPITTTKDFVRLPPEARPMVDVLRVRLTWEDAGQAKALLQHLADPT